MANIYSHLSLPPALLGKYSLLLRTASHLYQTAQPLLAYYALLYLVHSFIAIISDYLDHSINKHQLSVLEIQQLLQTTDKLIEELEHQKSSLAQSGQHIAFRKNAVINGQDTAAYQALLDKVESLSTAQVLDKSIASIESQFKQNITQLEQLTAQKNHVTEDVTSTEGGTSNPIEKDVTDNGQLAIADGMNNTEDNHAIDKQSIDSGSPEDDSDTHSAKSDGSDIASLHPISFGVANIISKEILSKNYLIDQAFQIVDRSVEAVENNTAEKKAGKDLLTASLLLEIAVNLYPIECSSGDAAAEAQPQLGNNSSVSENEINLDNIESIFASEGTANTQKHTLLTEALVSNKELKRKIKYSKLAGVKIIKLIKQHDNDFTKIDFSRNHQLMMDIIKLTETEAFSQESIKDTIKSALAETSDNEETSDSQDLFPKIPTALGKKDAGADKSSSKEFITKKDDASSVKSVAGLTSKSPKEETPLSVPELIRNDALLSEAKKRCKYAISALEYEDGSTALEELEDAIKFVKQFQELKQ